jgi:hypothetical protein
MRKQVDRTARSTAPRRPVATRSARAARPAGEGLELMTLRTIEYPDGRRVQLLVPMD